jgi:hypothetical protein
MKTIIKEPDYMGKNRKGFRKVISLFLILLGIVTIALTGDALSLIGGGGGLTLGAIAAPGEVIVGETPSTGAVDKASPDLLREAILKKVIQTHPSSYPLDTLMQYMSQQSTPSWEFRAYDTPYLPYRSTVKTASAGALAPGDPVDLSPANIEHVRNQSCLFFKSISGAATKDGKWLAVHVINVQRGGTLLMTVIPLNATGDLMPAIPADTEFIIGPIAANELDMQVESQIPVPQNYSNYNQLFMCQMEIGEYEEAHLKEVGWGWSDIQDYTIMDFRFRRTISYYLGYAAKFVDSNRQVEKYSTGGIGRQMTRQYTAPSVWTEADFVDFSEEVFIGNKGSLKKICLFGNTLISNISKVNFVQKQLAAGSTEVVFGLTFNKIKTNYGELLVHYDPLFTEMGMPDQGVVLDPEFLVRTNFHGIHHDKIDSKHAGWKRAKIESIAEASAALLRNRDAHLWIKS